MKGGCSPQWNGCKVRLLVSEEGHINRDIYPLGCLSSLLTLGAFAQAISGGQKKCELACRHAHDSCVTAFALAFDQYIHPRSEERAVT
jgi:hypothetical protein